MTSVMRTGAKVDLEGYYGVGVGCSSGWGRLVVLGANCGIHVDDVGTMLFPLGLAADDVVLRKRVENYWLVEEEAPNWI